MCTSGRRAISHFAVTDIYTYFSFSVFFRHISIFLFLLFSVRLLRLSPFFSIQLCLLCFSLQHTVVCFGFFRFDLWCDFGVFAPNRVHCGSQSKLIIRPVVCYEKYRKRSFAIRQEARARRILDYTFPLSEYSILWCVIVTNPSKC